VIIPTVGIVPHNDYHSLFRIPESFRFGFSYLSGNSARPADRTLSGFLHDRSGMPRGRENSPSACARVRLPRRSLRVTLVVRAIVVCSYKVDVAASLMVRFRGRFEVLEGFMGVCSQGFHSHRYSCAWKTHFVFLAVKIDGSESALEPAAGYVIPSQKISDIRSRDANLVVVRIRARVE